MTEQRKHWGALGTILWGAGIAIVFAVLQIIAMIAFVIHGNPGLTSDQLSAVLAKQQHNGVGISLATLLTTLLCVPLVLGIAKLKRGSRLAESLALGAVPLRPLGQWLGVTAVFLVASDALTVILGKPVVPDFMKTVYASAEPAWLLFLALVVAAPLFEEIFFRGFLFKGLEGAIKPTGAIVVTAALWAVIHTQYDLYGIATIFATGLLLGAARSRTNSIWASFAMHAMGNAVAFLETVLQANGVVT